MRKTWSRFLIIFLVLGIFPLSRCGSGLDPLAKEGKDAAMEVFGPYLIKCDDNYFVKGVTPNRNNPRIPDVVFMEMKGDRCGFTYNVVPLSESEKMNGVEFKAEVIFESRGPCRLWYQEGGWQAWTDPGYK